MEDARVRFGIIGCGGMAGAHITGLLQVPEAEVVALADPSAAAIDTARQRFPHLRGVPSFAEYREMLKAAALDAVVIATPHSLHFAAAADALEAGLHVLVEKPFVATVEQAELLLARAKQIGRVLGVAYQRHSQAPYRYMKGAIDDGRIGQVQYASIFLSQNWYNATKGTWRQSAELACGGELNDSGSHLLDMMLWMVGQAPVEVSAQIDRFDAEVDINSGVLIRFAGGAIGTVAVVGHAPGWGEEIQIFGAKGSLQYMNGKVYERLFDSPYIAEVVNLGRTVSVSRNFVDAVLGREALHAPAHVAVGVIALTTAAFAAARTGQPVKLGG